MSYDLNEAGNNFSAMLDDRGREKRRFQSTFTNELPIAWCKKNVHSKIKKKVKARLVIFPNTIDVQNTSTACRKSHSTTVQTLHLLIKYYRVLYINLYALYGLCVLRYVLCALIFGSLLGTTHSQRMLSSQNSVYTQNSLSVGADDVYPQQALGGHGEDETRGKFGQGSILITK